MSQQITTLTFFKYPELKQKFWAFGMMQFAHSPLKKVNGLQFYKLLGSGKKNFDPKPDWSVYGLLQVWENEESAKSFFANSNLYNRYQKHSSNQLTFYMKCIKAHGQWSKKNPFMVSENLDDNNAYISVITRATIKISMLKKFWDYVPTSQLDLVDNPNLLFTAGVGERPVTQMATFSLWNDARALKKFAYRSQSHRHAVQQTQALQWYKEEMFTRFQPYRIIGSWSNFEIPEGLQ
ncbi:Spheroidene monooxygenase [Nonlabens ulvanivorans]|uniref:Spheroidene monooxygenase n=1 Tax=Nonlabens ulvanivorans TaxID=906888 RepID=A0A081D972_NONUL|nr:hypothetical protein [Nonlabens ulvanivorans]GAK75468.1 spheroidene monooxygenase [Nonlabens ulvanivorans]GAL01901.1 Spheroidene monooxygenase [Nonlabens ulvanivorans]